MAPREHCPPDCSCRGTLQLVLQYGDPGYDEAIQRAVDRLAEIEASKLRHPSGNGHG